MKAVIDLDKAKPIEDEAWVCRVKKVTAPMILAEMHKRKIPKDMLTDTLAKEWFEQIIYDMTKNRIWVEA